MKREALNLPTFHFRGVPLALDSLVSVGYEEIGPSPRISIGQLALRPNQLGFFAFEAGPGASRLRVSLPRGTPPGNYKGSAEAGGKSFPVELHVEPYIHLSLSPRQLFLDAQAGQRVPVDLTLANSGNVALEVEKTYAFGLYEVDGAERGIAAAFHRKGDSAGSRVDHVLDQLAEGHGGLVRIQVEKGAGPIAPGEVRPIRMSFHFSTGLKAGRTYTGLLPMQNLRYHVEVRAISEGK